MARQANPVIDGRVTRTVTYTEADVVMVSMVDGKPVTTTGKATLSGDYKGDAERFRAACIQGGEYPTVAVAFNLRTKTELRGMNISTFISNSEPIDGNPSEYNESEDDD